MVSGLADAAVAADVGPMSAYMRHQFPFLGVKAPARKAAVRTAFAAAGPPIDEVEVVLAVDMLWALPEREYRYVGCLLAGRFAPRRRLPSPTTSAGGSPPARGGTPATPSPVFARARSSVAIPNCAQRWTVGCPVMICG